VREDEFHLPLAPLPSGRHGLPREEVVRSQRARLLRGAVEVAGADGFAGMTVTAVIRRASVSRKTFYELFTDREDCFVAAYGLVMDRALRGLRVAFEVDAPWDARVRAGLEWALDALASHPCEARVAFVEVLAAGPRALEQRDRFAGEFALLLADGFDAAPDDVVVPLSMPAAVIGALGELIGARVRRGGAAGLPELLPDALYCALAPFLGPAAAAAAAAGGLQPLAAGARTA
jgi:AcrR family transcriptional regulator